MIGRTIGDIVILKRDRESIRLSAVFAFLAVVCMPFGTVKIGGIGLMLLISVPMLFLCMPILLSYFRQPVQDNASMLLIAFFACCILGYIWTPYFSRSSLYNFLKIAAIVTCLYCQPYNRREKKLLLAGSVLACAIVCWWMLTGNDNIGYHEGRASLSVFGVLQDRNYQCFVFMAPMALVVYYFLNSKSFAVRLLCLAFAGVVLYCELLTGSRGGLIALAVVGITCVLGKFKSPGARIAFCIAMIFAVLIVFKYLTALLPEELAMRFTIRNMVESRATKRIDIWLEAFYTMKRAPYRLLFGFGGGSSSHLLGMATHNYFIQLLLEYGIVGLTLFCVFLVIWIKRLAKRDLMCLSMLLGNMMLAMSLSVNTMYCFWIPMMLSIVCSKDVPELTEGAVE